MYSNHEYYKSEMGTLGTRVDLAWDCCTSERASRKEKEAALVFLIFAFDLNPWENPDMRVSDQIALMMIERELYRDYNPDYIPNQAPKILDEIDIDPSFRIIDKIEGYLAPDLTIRKAIRNRHLLDVNALDKTEDKFDPPTYLTAEERAKRRLMIYRGEFYHEGEKFDSSKFIAHDKAGYVAFTVNANGEISFFKHLGGELDEHGNVFLHSSMNGGAPVFAAGELKIEDGKLKEINTYSGHYKPSLYNVYHLLSHFQEKKVDLSDVKVLTFHKLPKQVSGHCNKNLDYNMYETPAEDILDHMKQVFDANIAALNQYKKGDLKHNFLRVIGYKLTVKREKLAKQFSSDIDAIFKAGHLKPEEKIDCIKQMTEAYIEDNNAFGRSYGKEEDTGKLGQVFCLFNDRISEVEDQINEISEQVCHSYKSFN